VLPPWRQSRHSGSRRPASQTGELASVLTQKRASHLGHDLTGLVEVDLGDEEGFAFSAGDRGVPGDDLCTGFGSGHGRGRDLIAGVIGEHDDVVAAGGCIGYELDLAGDAILSGGADEVELTGIAQLGMRFLRALVRLIEDGDTEELGQEHHVDFLPRRRRDGFATGSRALCSDDRCRNSGHERANGGRENERSSFHLRSSVFFIETEALSRMSTSLRGTSSQPALCTVSGRGA
jgi:hypothetical protein